MEVLELLFFPNLKAGVPLEGGWSFGRQWGRRGFGLCRDLGSDDLVCLFEERNLNFWLVNLVLHLNLSADDCKLVVVDVIDVVWKLEQWNPRKTFAKGELNEILELAIKIALANDAKDSELLGCRLLH